jgi:hypothetical protein
MFMHRTDFFCKLSVSYLGQEVFELEYTVLVPLIYARSNDRRAAAPAANTCSFFVATCGRWILPVHH